MDEGAESGSGCECAFRWRKGPRELIDRETHLTEISDFFSYLKGMREGHSSRSEWNKNDGLK